MDDFSESSWWNYFFKKLENLTKKSEDKAMKDICKKSNSSPRNLKQLFLKYIKEVLVSALILCLVLTVQYAFKAARKSAQEMLADQTTIQLGTGDPVAIDKDSSTMLAHKKLIDIETVVTTSPKPLDNDNNDMVTLKVPTGKTSLFAFPDGSKVLLNSMSKVWYSRAEFKKNKRKVHLEGHAYFEIEPDEQRPFSVVTDSLNVTVVGTSFDIKCYQSEGQSKVAVRTGKVLVEKIKGQDKLILTKGKLAVLDKASGKFASEKYDSLVAFGWIQDYYILQNKSLDELCAELSRLYDEKILIDNLQPAGRRFFLRFNRNKPLSVILRDLQENEGLYFYKTKDNVWHIQ